MTINLELERSEYMRLKIIKIAGYWVLGTWYCTIILTLLLSGCSGSDDVPTLIEKARQDDGKAAMNLVRAMGSADRDVALAAYSGVIDLGIDFQPWLIKGLESPNDSVVEASAAALGNLGDSGSLPALIRILEGDGARRYAAAWALGEIGDLTAVPNVVPILGSKDMLLRKSAVRALVKLGPEAGAAVTTFLSAAKDAGSERAAIRVVGELKTGMAIDILISINGPNRDAAAWALGRIGGEGVLEPLLEALSDPRWQVRREAAQALGSLEDENAVPALTGALEDPVTVVREWAARSLETITGRKVLYMGEDGVMVPPYNLYR
jgi:HEAT repeat protein